MNRKGSLFFHFSNEVDALFEQFSNHVRASCFFDSKYVVVPSQAAENSLKKKVANSLGICMGLNFSSMQPIISKMMHLFFPEVKIESHLELALKIELKIQELIQSPDIHSKVFEPLLSYLQVHKSIDQERLTSLSDHLASLFVTYALYNRNLKKEWHENFKDHWQKRVWEMVFKPGDYYYDPYQVLKIEPKEVEKTLSLFIFNISFLPKPYFYFLKHLSQRVQVEFYQISVCSYFWSDLYSDFEKSVYLNKMRKKQISKKELDDLEGYLSHSNALLANYGKLGREWIKIIETDEDLLTNEAYFAPEKILKIPSYEKWAQLSELDFRLEPFTLLKALKTDLLLMLSKGEPISFHDDHSIEIHRASTYQREVEVMHDNLIKLLAENKNLKPSDITVYVSKIENYIPYLKTLFKEQEKIEVAIYNTPFRVHNSALKGFYQLIELANDRWDVRALLQLFHHPAFKNKFKITNEIVNEWQEWIQEAGVCFGYNLEDQKEKLEMQYEGISLNNQRLPSFEDLIQSLLKYLCQKHDVFETIVHLSSVDFSKADSINLLIEILDSLKQDLMMIKENKMSLASWGRFLECLFESYFLFDQDEKSNYLEILSRFSLSCSSFSESKEIPFSFETVYHYLKKDLNDLESIKSSSQLQTINVYSLGNSPALDSKVVYVLGLNDLEFPRPKVENPLCLMPQFKNKDFWPQSMEYDRYLFLEMMMSAKEHLFLSYLGYSTETFKEVEPSILISELLSYLDKRFILNGQKPSEVLVQSHPHLCFNSQDFNKKNYHLKGYPLAKSYYQEKKLPKKGLVYDFLEGKKTLSFLNALKENTSILIKDLCQLSRNSIQFSLNRGHQIFLEKESIAHENQNYSISGMQRALLRKRLFKNEEIPKEEGFPKGVFREIALSSLENEFKELQIFLNELGLKEEDFFSVEFRSDIKDSLQVNEHHWVVPSIKMEMGLGKKVEIVGLLEDVSHKGLLSHKTLDEESLLLEWPRYLVYLMLKNHLPFERSPQLIFSKSRKNKVIKIDSVDKLLEEYLQFYFLSAEYICPFLPGWIPYFMKYELSEIQRKIKQDLESRFFYNQYTKMLMGQQMPKESVIDAWKEMAQTLFKNTYAIISS